MSLLQRGGEEKESQIGKKHMRFFFLEGEGEVRVSFSTFKIPEISEDAIINT